jgi:hypothetical protein
MNLRAMSVLAVLFGAVGSAPALTDNPYAAVVERNIFNLQPIPTNSPAEVKPPEPPSKIIPNGIINIFGKVQVLFKVQSPARLGQPAKEQSYVMGEGERQDEIEVRKIDEKNATITFDNHGIVQSLELVKATGGGGGVPPTGSPGGAGVPHTPAALAGKAGGLNPAAAATIGNRFGRRPSTAAAPSGSTGATSDAANAASAREVNERGIYQPKADSGDQLTAEQRIILIEAQRAKLLEEGDSKANLLPTTPLTKELMGGEDEAQ